MWKDFSYHLAQFVYFLVISGRLILCHVGLCEPAGSWTVFLFLVPFTGMLFDLKKPLISLGDKPLTAINSSEANTYIFQWCLETELSISKDLLKPMYCEYILYTSISHLRILTEKKHPKIKLQRLRKIRISTFGSLVQ